MPTNANTCACELADGEAQTRFCAATTVQEQTTWSVTGYEEKYLASLGLFSDGPHHFAIKKQSGPFTYRYRCVLYAEHGSRRGGEQP